METNADLEARTITEWAIMLQDYTDQTVPFHSLPSSAYRALGISSEPPTETILEGDEHAPVLSSRLVLDMDKDPLFTLCHPSVITMLLQKIAQMGFTIAYGVTGQVQLMRNHSSECPTDVILSCSIYLSMFPSPGMRTATKILAT